MSEQRSNSNHGDTSDTDIRAAISEVRQSPLGRLGLFFKAVGAEVRLHPWYTVLILTASIAFCPICKYFAAMLFAGGLIWAFRRQTTQA